MVPFVPFDSYFQRSGGQAPAPKIKVLLSPVAQDCNLRLNLLFLVAQVCNLRLNHSH